MTRRVVASSMLTLTGLPGFTHVAQNSMLVLICSQDPESAISTCLNWGSPFCSAFINKHHEFCKPAASPTRHFERTALASLTDTCSTRGNRATTRTSAIPRGFISQLTVPVNAVEAAAPLALPIVPQATTHTLQLYRAANCMVHTCTVVHSRFAIACNGLCNATSSRCVACMMPRGYVLQPAW